MHYIDKIINTPPHLLVSTAILLALLSWLAYTFSKARYQSVFDLGKGSSKDVRDPLLDIVRGAAIINIIFIHSVWWSGETYIRQDLIRQLALLIDVPLFFFISGWTSSNKGFTLARYGSRLLKLYLPYVVMVLFLVVLYWRRNSTIVSGEDMISWLTLDYWNVKGQYNAWACVIGSLWFLQVFLIISIFSPLIAAATRHRAMKYAPPMVLLALVLVITFKQPAWGGINIFGWTSLSNVIFYAFFYTLGQAFSGAKLGRRNFAILAALNLLLLVGYMALFDINFNLQANKFPPKLFYLIASMLSVLMVFYLNSFSSWFDTHSNIFLSFLRQCGKSSYSIYLYQGFGAMMAYYVVGWLSGYHWTIILVAAFAFNLAISLALAQIFGYINDMVIKKTSIIKMK